MPNVFSCNPEWFKRLKDEQPNVVVAMWSSQDADRTNKWLERLQLLEDENIPVFVCDLDSCPDIAEIVGASKSGETIVFRDGKEEARLEPSEDVERDIEKVKKIIR